MSSKVNINMFPCQNTSLVEVSAGEDGTYDVRVTTTCPKAQKLVEGLGPLSLIDLVQKDESKIFKHFLASDMSANCLLPSGIMTAAWVEAGMIARSVARGKKALSIEFVPDE
jgi:hypothetical protein